MDYQRRDLEAWQQFLRTGEMAAAEDRFVIYRIPPASNTFHLNLHSLVASDLFVYPNFTYALMYCFGSLSRRAVLNQSFISNVYNN